MNVKRWVVLPESTDKKLKEDAKKQDRSIANLLKRIITQFYDKS